MVLSFAAMADCSVLILGNCSSGVFCALRQDLWEACEIKEDVTQRIYVPRREQILRMEVWYAGEVCHGGGSGSLRSVVPYCHY